MIFIGADHRGFKLKEDLKEKLEADGYEVEDLGDDHLDKKDDYVIFAHQVADAVSIDPENKGILLCGSGAGVDMVANKIDGVRSALVFDVPRAIQARQHEDANVLSLPADILDEKEAYKIVTAFLETEFSGEQRHERRLEEMSEVEEEH